MTNNVKENTFNIEEEESIEFNYENPLIYMLDDDCMQEIYSFLSIEDLFQVNRVCKSWNILCQDIWKNFKILTVIDKTWYCSSNKRFSRMYTASTEKQLRQILIHCHQHIKLLDLSYLKWDHDSTKLVSNIIIPICSNLHEVTIKSHLKRPVIKSLCYNCPKIEKLVLGRIEKNDEELLIDLLKKKKELKDFTLKYGIKKSMNSYLSYLPNTLEHLTLKRLWRLDPNIFISKMRSFEGLVSLSLHIDPAFNDSSMKCIGEMKTLRSLSLKNYLEININPSAFNYLSNLTNLVELTIMLTCQLSDECLINIMEHCKEIKVLDLSCCSAITDDGIQSVCQLPKLEMLIVNGLHEITDKSIINLPDTIQIFKCSSCSNITDYSIIHLMRKATELRVLGLHECSVSNDTIESAIDIVKRNNHELHIIVGGTKINWSLISEVPKLLHLISPYNRID